MALRFALTRPIRSKNVIRSMAIFPEKRMTDDQPTKTPISTILDRTAEVFFMTEIFRALWLTLEVALKPKVTINYPFEKGPISPRFRGEHGMNQLPLNPTVFIITTVLL